MHPLAINVVTDRREFYIHSYTHTSWDTALRDIRADRPCRIYADGNVIFVENHDDARGERMKRGLGDG